MYIYFVDTGCTPFLLVQQHQYILVHSQTLTASAILSSNFSGYTIFSVLGVEQVL